MDHITETKGATNAYMAETMNVSVRWVKMLCARYRNVEIDRIAYPVPMGRPRDGLPGRREHSAVLTARRENHVGAVRLHRRIEGSTETRSVIRNHAVPARGRPAAAPLRGSRLSSSGWSG